jgi:hypothetical protein
MVSAFTRLARENLSTLTPDALYALFSYSHPPVPSRIARLRGAAPGWRVSSKSRHRFCVPTRQDKESPLPHKMRRPGFGDHSSRWAFLLT